MLKYLKLFNYRRALTVFLITLPISFLTFLLVQYLQGQMGDYFLTFKKVLVICTGLGLMFGLPEKKERYPWM